MQTHSGVLISSVPSRSSLSVYTSDGLWHSYFRIVASLVNQYSGSHLTFSSYTMLILAFHRGLGFRRDRRGSPQVLQVYFAALRDSLVTPQSGVMGLGLPSGGHLTHGYHTVEKKIPPHSSTSSISRTMCTPMGIIEYKELRKQLFFRTAMILCGASAY